MKIVIPTYKRPDGKIDALENGWIKAKNDSVQNVIRQYVAEQDQKKFDLDMYNDTTFKDNLWIRVLVNNVLKKQTIDYTIEQDVNDESSINFVKEFY